jgi:hypothetical protein
LNRPREECDVLHDAEVVKSSRSGNQVRYTRDMSEALSAFGGRRTPRFEDA